MRPGNRDAAASQRGVSSKTRPFGFASLRSGRTRAIVQSFRKGIPGKVFDESSLRSTDGWTMRAWSVRGIITPRRYSHVGEVHEKGPFTAVLWRPFGSGAGGLAAGAVRRLGPAFPGRAGEALRVQAGDDHRRVGPRGRLRHVLPAGGAFRRQLPAGQPVVHRPQRAGGGPAPGSAPGHEGQAGRSDPGTAPSPVRPARAGGQGRAGTSTSRPCGCWEAPVRARCLVSGASAAASARPTRTWSNAASR